MFGIMRYIKHDVTEGRGVKCTAPYWDLVKGKKASLKYLGK